MYLMKHVGGNVAADAFMNAANLRFQDICPNRNFPPSTNCHEL